MLKYIIYNEVNRGTGKHGKYPHLKSSFLFIGCIMINRDKNG